MDFQTIVNLTAGVMLPVLGWLVNANAVLRRDLTVFQVKVAEDYVRHDQLDDIKSTLRRIEDKLDGKADK